MGTAANGFFLQIGRSFYRVITTLRGSAVYVELVYVRVDDTVCAEEQAEGGHLSDMWQPEKNYLAINSLSPVTHGVHKITTLQGLSMICTIQ
jgi:hypothetical protein